MDVGMGAEPTMERLPHLIINSFFGERLFNSFTAVAANQLL